MAKVLLSMLILAGASGVLSAPGPHPLLPNFYAVDVLADGELERRFFLDGVAGKETSAIFVSNGTREGAVLRQMADGRHLIQLIYDADEKLLDCEYLMDSESSDRFQRTMVDEFDVLKSLKSESDGEDFVNSTVRTIGSASELPTELAKLVDYVGLKKQCRKLHQRIRSSRMKRDVLMMPGTNWCGAGHRAGSYSDLGAEQKVDYCCRRHDHCPEVIRSQMTKYDVTNRRPITVSHCDCDERRHHRISGGATRTRRGLEDLYLVPHTNWCGKGNRAGGEAGQQLGGYQAADKCCRDHDLHCPHFIPGYGEAYSLYNSRPFTAMHCSCDDRFRSCLKQANTAASNLVGKLFFNIIQTKCFVLKPEKVCKRSSWWGKCTASEWKKKAHLRDPIPY